MAPLLYIQELMPVPRTGLRVRLYVTVMIAMFTKCLRPICHQYARTYYQKQPRHTRQYSLNVQNIEGRVDSCAGCRIVEYLLSTVFLLCIGLRPQVCAFAISIIVRFNYLHGARSASGELIGNLAKVSLGYGKIRSRKNEQNCSVHRTLCPVTLRDFSRRLLVYLAMKEKQPVYNYILYFIQYYVSHSIEPALKINVSKLCF